MKDQMKSAKLSALSAALFLSLTMLVTSCSKQDAAPNASAPANEPAKAKPFEGQVFRTADDRQAITLISKDELEMRGGDAGPDNLICKYTRQDDTLRVVQTMLGTTLAVYYKITPQGLQAKDGTVLFNPANIRAQIAGRAWYQQLAEVDTAMMFRHAATEFLEVRLQAGLAADLMAKQPEQAAPKLDAATAKLKEIVAQARIKKDLYVQASARAQNAYERWTKQLAEVDEAVLLRHAAAEFQEIKAQVMSASRGGFMFDQPEQAAEQLDAATAKLKDVIAQVRIKEKLAK